MPAVPYQVIYKDQIDNQAIKYSKPTFIHTWVSGTTYSGQFAVEGLEAGTEYTMFCYGENLNRLSSLHYLNVEFATNGFLNSAPEDGHFCTADY